MLSNLFPALGFRRVNFLLREISLDFQFRGAYRGLNVPGATALGTIIAANWEVRHNQKTSTCDLPAIENKRTGK